MVYCLRPGLRHLRIEPERVFRGAANRHGVAAEGGEFAQQGTEAVHRQRFRGALLCSLAARRGGTLGRGNDGVALGSRRCLLVVVEQDRRQCFAQVPFDITGQHAQQ